MREHGVSVRFLGCQYLEDALLGRLLRESKEDVDLAHWLLQGLDTPVPSTWISQLPALDVGGACARTHRMCSEIVHALVLE